MAKKHKVYKPKKIDSLYLCTKCLTFSKMEKDKCDCGCKTMIVSVLRKVPKDVFGIPQEDLIRVMSYRKTNGHNYSDIIQMYKSAPILGVRIPAPKRHKGFKNLQKRRNSDCYGVARHYAPSKYVTFVSGGTC